jgi:sugar phosphate isomerase/epimerase
MNITYAISQWNFSHYAGQPNLERVIERVRALGYGFEFWGGWSDDRALYDAIGRRRLATAARGMAVSLHTMFGCQGNFERHRMQIDTAAAVGARMVVLHPDDLETRPNGGPDGEFIARIMAYARENGVRLCVENGALEFVQAALDLCPDLGFCLDIGHVYLERRRLADFLTPLKHRVVHLHLQDILPPDETETGGLADHYILGTGGIPPEDWDLLAATLREVDYDGMGVFEIHPRDAIQTAFLGRRFLEARLREAPAHL